MVQKFLTAACAALLCSASALAEETVKVAYLDPLSGPFANVGELGAKQYQFAFDQVNAKGGVLGGTKIELITFDSKASAQEALVVLKQVADRGIRYLIQGNSSAVAGALVDAVAKHNRRNPDKTILYMNYGAVDPALTNEKCNFWHFRFDVHADMKMEAVSNAIQRLPNVKKVYLINQDYAFGQAVKRAAREMLNRKRSDIQIVGDDLHPLGKIKDFSPYIQKIKASGADSVITGNWGNDLSLLVKAGKDAGLKVDYFTYYAGFGGVTTALGDAGIGHVKQITPWHSNIANNKTEKDANEFKKKFGIDFYWLGIKTHVGMFVNAIEKAKSADPEKVGKAFENMRYMSDTGEVQMRAEDHQIIVPMYVSTLVKTDGREVKYDVENTGLGFKTDSRLETKDVVLPTTCRMVRP